MSTTPSVGRTLSLRTVLQVITALCAALPLALGLIPDVSTAVTVWTLAICGVLAVVINAGWVAYETVRKAPAPNTTPLVRVIRTAVYVIAAVLATAATAFVALPIDAGAAAQIAGILAALVVVIAAVWNVLEAAAGGTLTIEPPLPARKA